MAGSLKKKPGMGMDKAPTGGKAQPGKKKKRSTAVKAVKKAAY